ncbi:MAG: sigma-54-dependent Fis family transcriptional regulator [Gammaproteobacteria bacterium]|nr:sigma-54-dependent Fis family transcriptional regulator [Gammaproteobacteria bacterium]
MTDEQIKLLLVEDTESLSLVYQGYLSKENYAVTSAMTGQQALDFIKEDFPDILLLDINLPDISGIEILKQAQEECWPIAIIVITANDSVDMAVETMRLGAVDFISKPFDANRLIVTIKNVTEKLKLNRIVKMYQENYARDTFHSFIGSSLKMQAVYRIIESAAPSKASVFITGESGTGKELCAEALHLESTRKEQAFIPLNCAAIPKELMESEIFGHIKGAFTGAQKDREGAASLANQGTLFLDEICEMDMELQSKLLRFLQTGTYQKVGSSKVQQCDIRFICATNRDPMEEVKAGRFREDLYYRLHVIPIELPPLRERDDDVIHIARHFLDSYNKEENKTFKSFAFEVERILLQYNWPGNIRQLLNVIRNIVVLNTGKVVTPEMLPPPLDDISSTPIADKYASSDELEQPSDQIQVQNSQASPGEYQIIPLWKVEKKVINEAIDACDGNIPQAAAQLEVSPSTIYRKKQSWDEQL